MSIKGIDQATTTMNQLQQQMDMISNNMSNSSTTGFKSKQAEFSSLLFQQMNNMTDPQNATGRITPNGIRTGIGARLGAINSDTSMGSLHQTDRDLDLALIAENHFFEIDHQEGANNTAHFTRDGSFYLQPVNNDTELELVTKNGHHIMGRDGEPIRFAAGNIDDINIESDGSLMIQRGQQTENVGSISIVSIDNPRILEVAGDNEYRLPDADDIGNNDANIVQDVQAGSDLIQAGALEMSNVNIADEMTNLINAQRAYQFNARTISTADEMQGLINQMR